MSDAVVNGLAGAGGGIIAQLLTYPLQAVNTRQQTERKLLVQKLSPDSSGSAAPTDEEARKIVPAGTAALMWAVVKKEGWGGLYRGLAPSLVGTAASQGVYYYFYQLLRERAEVLEARRRRKLPGAGGRGGGGGAPVGMLTSLIVAALAGCLNVLLTNPIWVIVTRMQTQSQIPARRAAGLEAPVDLRAGPSTSAPSGVALSKRGHAGALETIRELYREEGILGFWKGVFPTLIMVCNPALQFALYEGMLARLTARRPRTPSAVVPASATEVFALGALAKLGATVVTYPLLVVKSRLQAKQDIGADAKTQYTGTLDAILKMVRHEGLLGFYRGMSTKIVQSVFAAAVLFMTKEELVKLARALVERRRELAATLARVKTE